MSRNENNWLLGIRNVVFDLGGVVIDLDRNRAVRALEELGLEGVGRMLDQYVQSGPFLALETGRLTAGGFFDELRAKCSRPGVSDREITEAFNRFLVALPAARLTRLREMRMAGFGVFALSNTNPVMYDSWIAEAFRQEGGNICDYFDGIVTSFQEQCCKPDPRIFETVVNRYGLQRSQTLFLDDSEANCRAAAECGIHALRVGSTRQDDMMAYTSLLLSLRAASMPPGCGMPGMEATQATDASQES